MAAVSDSLHEIDDDPALATESAAAEIRVALRLTRRAADTELNLALDLGRRLPRVWELLAAGDIDLRRARTITHGTAHLSITQAREVIEEVIEDAPRLTTGELVPRPVTCAAFRTASDAAGCILVLDARKVRLRPASFPAPPLPRPQHRQRYWTEHWPLVSAASSSKSTPTGPPTGTGKPSPGGG
jgi:hypothetical protein